MYLSLYVLSDVTIKIIIRACCEVLFLPMGLMGCWEASGKTMATTQFLSYYFSFVLGECKVNYSRTSTISSFRLLQRDKIRVESDKRRGSHLGGLTVNKIRWFCCGELFQVNNFTNHEPSACVIKHQVLKVFIDHCLNSTSPYGLILLTGAGFTLVLNTLERNYRNI